MHIRVVVCEEDRGPVTILRHAHGLPSRGGTGGKFAKIRIILGEFLSKGVRRVELPVEIRS